MGRDFKVIEPLNIYPVPLIEPRWWHRLIFWKKYDYSRWYFERSYKTLKELIREQAGVSGTLATPKSRED